MDDPFDALAPPPERDRRRGNAASATVAFWRERLGDRPWAQGGAAATALVAIGVVGLLTMGAWWLSRGRAEPVELPRAPSAVTQADAATSPPPTIAAEGGDTTTSLATTFLAPQEVVVHVAGQVQHPGLYTVNAGGRLADAVSAAGGVTAQADLDRVNLAEPLIDGARTYIPAVGQPDAPGTIPQGAQSPPAASNAPASNDPASNAPSSNSPAGTGSTGTGSTGAGSTGAGGEGDLVNINTADEAALDELPGIGPVTATAIVEYRGEVGSFSQVEDLLEVRGIGDAKLEALVDLVTL